MPKILADYDTEGVYVYQAFKPSIVKAALTHGTFAAGFNLDRMTWIKPSLGWMLYRSGYATKHRQEAILRIKLSHEGWQTILSRAVLSHYPRHQYETRVAWNDALRHSEVRCQWDPDRDLRGYRLDRRAIQLGLRGETVRQYVNTWIVGLTEITALAHAIRAAMLNDTPLPETPEERPYPCDVAAHLGVPVEPAGVCDRTVR